MLIPLQPPYNIITLNNKNFTIYIIYDNNRKTQHYIFGNIQDFLNDFNNTII